MTPLGEMSTEVLAAVTVLGDLGIVVFLVAYIFFRKPLEQFFQTVGKWGIQLAAAFAFCALFGAIVYSQITGFPACPLCFIQRVAMGALMLVLLYGIITKKRVILAASIVAAIGAAVALYQYVLQFMVLYGVGKLPCPAVSSLPSCDKIYVLEYGYVTIPMFALTAFIEIGIFLFLARRYQQSSQSVLPQ